MGAALISSVFLPVFLLPEPEGNRAIGNEDDLRFVFQIRADLCCSAVRFCFWGWFCFG
jgi:hypothetical protein